METRIGMNEPLASFLRIERAGADAWTARLADLGWGKALGGDVLARAVLVASGTGDRTALHSLHAYFLRPAPAGGEILLRVASLREGGGRVQRRVALWADKREICEVMTSFTATREGPSYQVTPTALQLPAPETLPNDVELARAEGWPELYLSPIEWRRVGPAWPFPRAPEAVSVHWTGWFRPRVPLPADPQLHTAALVLLSDHSSHWGVETRLGPDFPRHDFVSLDHAVWIHRPVRWDDWLLMTTASDVSHAGRALIRREIFTREGLLVASVAQEALVTERDGANS